MDRETGDESREQEPLIDDEEILDIDDADEGAETEGDADGEGGDEGGEESEASGGGRGQATESKPSRGAGRIARLAERTRIAEEEARAARAEAAESRRIAEQRAHRESEAEERARLELMTPEERFEHRLTKSERQAEQRIQALQLQLGNDSDRATFASLCGSDRALASVKDEVEKQHADLVRQGMHIRREVLANQILGQRLRERGGRAAAKQRRGAETRTRREAAKPGAGRGDVADAGRRSGKSLRDKLDGVQI